MSERVFLQNQSNVDLGLELGQVIDPEKVLCYTKRKDYGDVGESNPQMFTTVFISM